VVLDSFATFAFLPIRNFQTMREGCLGHSPELSHEKNRWTKNASFEQLIPPIRRREILTIVSF
jgi:hypothetical protein